jgi:hypothetical protein
MKIAFVLNFGKYKIRWIWLDKELWCVFDDLTATFDKTPQDIKTYNFKPDDFKQITVIDNSETLKTHTIIKPRLVLDALFWYRYYATTWNSVEVGSWYAKYAIPVINKFLTEGEPRDAVEPLCEAIAKESNQDTKVTVDRKILSTLCDIESQLTQIVTILKSLRNEIETVSI